MTLNSLNRLRKPNYFVHPILSKYPPYLLHPGYQQAYPAVYMPFLAGLLKN